MSHSSRSSVQIHVKNVPSHVNKHQWYSFVNKLVKHKKWLKNYKSHHSNEWVIVVKEHEKDQWYQALNNKTCFQQRINVYVKSGGHRKSAFNHNDKNYRAGKGGKYRNAQLFTKHLSKEQQNKMLSLCGTRYQTDSKLLNLNGIITDEHENWASFHNHAFVEHLFNIIKNNCHDVKSINLANNRIESLLPFSKMMQFTPCLENLSLMDNPIKSFDEFQHLKSLKNTLRELHLRNSILLNEMSGIKAIYQYEIIKRFPSLKMLDGEVINQQSLISFGTNLDDLANNFKQQCVCIPVSPHNQCMNQSQIQQFIDKYYQIFDDYNKRRQIINLYHVDAVFTLTYTTSDTPTPTENRSNSHNLVNQACNKVNRNLIDDYFQKMPRYKQMERVKHGNIDIVKYLQDDFPKNTKHKISYLSIDCHPLKMGDNSFMQVLINGYYAENQDVARKFNRTWLLMQDNNNIIITNDQLHIGGVVPQIKLKQYAPASSIADCNNRNIQGNVPNGSTNTSLMMNGNSNINANQQGLIQKMMSVTGCPEEIARNVLVQNNWDPNKAHTVIQTMKQQQMK